MPQTVGQFLRRRHQVEDLLRGCHLARESLCTMAGGTASRAEVGMAQLRVPVRKGKREKDSVGGTWRDNMDES